MLTFLGDTFIKDQMHPLTFARCDRFVQTPLAIAFFEVVDPFGVLLSLIENCLDQLGQFVGSAGYGFGPFHAGTPALVIRAQGRFA